MGKDKLVKIKYDPNDKRCQNLVGVDKLLDILETDEFKQEFAKFNERIGLPYNKEMLTSSKKNKAKDGNMKRAISGKTPKTRLRYSGTYKNKDGSTTVVKGYQVTTYDKGQSSTVEYTDDELEKYFGAGSGAIKVMT
ncbi:MAG: hypothetical protein FWE72_06805, partial [Spirochaetaceae bacterium]|nr:hypothetical protein [Spirochaetaceae bacterium]